MNNVLMSLVVRRFLSAILTLFLVSVVVFAITNILPGDAAQQILGQFAMPEQVAALRAQLGLDQPAIARYFHWLFSLLSGDPGQSFANNMPVSKLMDERLQNTLMLAAATSVISVPVALFLGIFSAIYRNGRVDKCLNTLTLALVAVPEFLVATIAVLIFAVKLHWFSAISYGGAGDGILDFLRAYTLPVMTLCFVITAQMARMTRAAMVDELSTSYVEMAYLKGLSTLRIAIVHALPNAIGPIANAVALSLSYLFGGVVIVEAIFNFPGIAGLMVDAVTNRDIALVQACTMLFCSGYLGLILIADICAIVFNPRLRNKV
ncbi:Glutathione transport system permease protein GsiC [Vibrio aerogenes CECT 7868]|uniref:Glutathione transport system permease protein GsiC n=1 Tax=Vibrio aerogenes CECT 7868 TaxID=1216006 RepID=A0A1M6D514_9VIBR|nr:ABC transporter permease [Vibrio aerogenes]SHI68362.1 Glutathione transport system permease protein GsiC [Vibrio aerogenes CECT 7868]